MNNDKVLNCNATIDVGAASMYTNAVSAFLAGTSGKESDAVVTIWHAKIALSNLCLQVITCNKLVLSFHLLIQFQLLNVSKIKVNVYTRLFNMWAIL